jgi:tetratricopeptide (TPR) repeat protein
MGNCYQNYELNSTASLGLKKEILNEHDSAFALILELIRTNEIERANTLADRYLINSRDPRILYQKMRILFANKEYEELILYCNESLELNPTSLETMFFKADALRYLNKLNEAIELLDKIIEMNPDCLKAYALKTMILMELNLLEEGLELADRCFLKFGHPNFLYYKSKILAKLELEESNELCDA